MQEESGLSNRMTEGALTWLQGFVERHAVGSRQRELLGLCIEQGRAQADPSHGLVAAELPLGAYRAAGGRGIPWPLAGACLCLYLGADVLDNVMDRELPDVWGPHGPALATLAGATFIGLAPMALAELDAAPALRRSLDAALTEVLMEMSAGQTDDLEQEGRPEVTLGDCERMVLRKSGAEAAFFARAGALAAGASAEACDAYAELGLHVGAALQILSDCADLLGDDSHDLAAAKRTLPIVFALAALQGEARSALLDELDRATRDPDVRRGLHRRVLEVGGLQYAVLVARVHQQRALAALGAAGSQDPTALEHFVGTLDPLRAADRS